MLSTVNPGPIINSLTVSGITRDGLPFSGDPINGVGQSAGMLDLDGNGNPDGLNIDINGDNFNPAIVVQPYWPPVWGPVPPALGSVDFRRAGTLLNNNVPPVCINPSDIIITNVNTGIRRVTVTIRVANNARLGRCIVAVTNPDGGQIAADFEITPGITVESITPRILAQGDTNRIVTINGSGFTDGNLFGVNFLQRRPVLGLDPSITVNSVNVVVSQTELIADITVGAATALGPHFVAVTNSDAGTTQFDGDATREFVVVNPVAGLPSVTDIIPNALGQGAGTIDLVDNITLLPVVPPGMPFDRDADGIDVTITGTNLQPIVDFGPGINVSYLPGNFSFAGQFQRTEQPGHLQNYCQ